MVLSGSDNNPTPDSRKHHQGKSCVIGGGSIRHRKRYQTCFLRWLKQNAHRFLLPPLKPKVKVGSVSLTFSNLNPHIQVRVCQNKLMVVVDHPMWGKRRFIDALLDLDLTPEWRDGGYTCNPCVGWLSENRKNSPSEVFPSLEALWEVHQFEVFLKWCNEKLVPATNLIMQIGITGSMAMLRGEFSEAEVQKYSLVTRCQNLLGVRFDRYLRVGEENRVVIAPVFPDPAFANALALVKATGSHSISHLQRHFRLGYARACAVMRAVETEIDDW